MRLWSIHPKYLDKHGLISLWREALLVQKILNQEIDAYNGNAQVERFKNYNDPIKAIGSYLSYIAAEGSKRGYKLSHEKILYPSFEQDLTSVNDGQLIFEMQHLRNKLKIRDKVKYSEIKKVSTIETNPLFDLTAGGIMDWEKSKTLN